jgi:hypothetical protein
VPCGSLRSSLRSASLRVTSLRTTSLRITSLRVTSLRVTSLRIVSRAASMQQYAEVTCRPRCPLASHVPIIWPRPEGDHRMPQHQFLGRRFAPHHGGL